MPLGDEVEAFTGRFGVVGVTPFTRRVYVALVDAAGTVWLARNDDPCELAAPPWVWEALGGAEPDTPLAATVRPGLLENPAFLFFHGPQGDVRRWTNSDGLWGEFLPISLGPETRCHAMDAIALPDGAYPATDVHLMCLSSGGLFDGSVLTVGDGVVVANHGPPPGTTAALRDHGIAAVATDDGVIHTAVLGEDRHLWLLRTGTELGWDDLGEVPDTSDVFGGLVAFASGSFLNPELHVAGIGQLTDAYYLIHRDLSREPGWAMLGTDVSVRAIALGPDAYTETRMAEHRGRLLTGMIRRSDVDTPAAVLSTWSTTDGLETDAPVPLPLFPGAAPHPYVTDPTTVVHSDGTARITALGIGPMSACEGTGGLDSTVWTCTTTDGTLNANDCHEIHSKSGGILDHPWTALTTGLGVDTVHYVWWDFEARIVEYCRESDDPGLSIDCSTPSALASTGTSPPTMTVDASQQTVYVAWGTPPMSVCAIDLLDPSGQCDYVVDLRNVADIRPWPIDPFFGPAPDDRIRGLQAWSLVASPTHPGRLYFAAHVCEPDLTSPSLCTSTLDVAFTTSSDGGLTWSPPILVNEAPEDGTDQFFPAITVATSPGDFDGDGLSDDQILITYYDRMSTATSIFPRSALFLRGLNRFVGHSFLHDPETPTDAFSLPRNCISKTLFIGDYHEGTGGRIHAHATLTEAYETGVAPNGDVWGLLFVPPGL